MFTFIYSFLKLALFFQIPFRNTHHAVLNTNKLALFFQTYRFNLFPDRHGATDVRLHNRSCRISGQRPAIGFDWLCFFAAPFQQNPHNPLLLLILCHFTLLEIGFVFSNWILSFDTYLTCFGFPAEGRYIGFVFSNRPPEKLRVY